MHDLTHLVRARAATGVNDLMSTPTRTAVALLFVISLSVGATQKMKTKESANAAFVE